MQTAARLAALVALLDLGIAGCAGDLTGVTGDVGDTEELAAADDSDTDLMYSGSFDVGQTVRVCNCSALNQRTGPGTSYGILRAMPAGSTVNILEASGNWYKNDWGGRVGWSSGSYLCATGGGGDTGGDSGGDAGGGSFGASLSRDGVIQIARAATGFSYYWGGARFSEGCGRGACYGNCPDCSHSGVCGADCSGFAGKAWQLPEAMPMDANKHPFSTYHFYNQSNHWSGVSRGSVARADAMVYRSGGGGHIFIYESGDGWGQMWTYEARGCSYGIVHNVRSASSSYKAIRRDGI